MYEENYKKEKRIKKLIIILSSVVILFLGYYFVNTYNKIKVYLINGSSENFTMRHGIFLATNNKFYFRLGKFNNGDEKAISEFHLYYLNEEKERVTLFRSDDSNILLVDEKGYDVYFEYDELPTIVANLYLDITYNGVIETMELNLEKDFANNYLTFFKEEKISEEEVENKVITEEIGNIEDIEKKMLDNFKYENGKYYYEFESNMFEYDKNAKVINMQIKKNQNLYRYYLKTKNISIIYYDKNENNIFENNNNDFVKLEDINEDAINAIISIEDKNFYNHNGFDILRIIKAMFINITSGEIKQGASTISQQYIKNLYLTFDKTWERKIEEAFLTIELETHYEKDEILEGYLNTIDFGAGNYGIKKASKYYFNKEPKDLTLEEATILAGIPKNPSYYNPITNIDAAKKRQKEILNSMYENNYIEKKQIEKTHKTELVFHAKYEKNELSSIH